METLDTYDNTIFNSKKEPCTCDECGDGFAEQMCGDDLIISQFPKVYLEKGDQQIISVRHEEIKELNNFLIQNYCKLVYMETFNHLFLVVIEFRINIDNTGVYK